MDKRSLTERDICTKFIRRLLLDALLAEALAPSEARETVAAE